MITYIEKRRKNLLCRILSVFICWAFIASTIMPLPKAEAQSVNTVLNLPAPGTMMGITPTFNPAMIKGMTIHLENPLQFDFIVGTGDTGLEGEALKDEALKDEAQKLIKYFMAALTVPEEDMWVTH